MAVDAVPPPPAPTTWTVARLLVRFRWRSLINGALRAPRRRSFRLAWLLVMLAPAAYVAIFASAFDLLAELAPFADQVAVLALAAGCVTVASAAAKMATTEAVVAGSGENELLLTRPLSLPSLVTARSLAGAATDLFDALFLFPILVAASLVWRLGLAGVIAAALTSVVVQVGVSAAAQAAQLVVVRLVPAARRRLVWALLALLAALTMACLWVVASWILRSPMALLERVHPWAAALRWATPGGAVVAPLVALADPGGARAAALAAAAAVPLAVSGAAMGAAWLASRWAGRRGWEQAGAPWAEAAPLTPARRWLPMTPFTKDWYLIVRDRSRLVTLVALPAIFIGLQVFGSAGWSWTTASPRHVAVLAFSLAAYMATFGPLGHMEAERHAFWLLRSSPVPLGRLLAAKAAFWSVVVGGTAALAATGLLAAGGHAPTAPALGTVALAVLGAVTVSWLAVGMASSVADFSEDHRRVGLTTVYLFMLVAGLFNVALLSDGGVRLRIVVLYLVAVGLHWLSGVQNAREVFDPESRAARPVSPGDGASLAILLVLGTRAQRMAAGGALPAWGEAVWPALLVAAAAIYLARRRGGRRQGGARRAWPVAAALLVGLLAGAGAAALAGARLGRAPGALAALAAPGVLRALAEELAVRGIVQRGLGALFPPPPGRGAALASAGVVVAAAALLALVVGGRPPGLTAALAAVVPGVVLALGGRLSAAIACRLVFEALLMVAVSGQHSAVS